MKERPILFSATMVRAILDGSKTQTRRVAKGEVLQWLEREKFSPAFVADAGNHLCPYGQSGDRLWVRESWFQRGKWLLQGVPNADADDIYWCGTQEIAYAANVKRPGHDWRSRPSIHMPRWASRITLEVTGVRVERLQDISEEDARAEGITDGGCLNCGNPETDCGCLNPQPDARDSFVRLWQSINGPKSWDANPWVWVVEFKRLEGGAA